MRKESASGMETAAVIVAPGEDEMHMRVRLVGMERHHPATTGHIAFRKLAHRFADQLGVRPRRHGEHHRDSRRAFPARFVGLLPLLPPARQQQSRKSDVTGTRVSGRTNSGGWRRVNKNDTTRSSILSYIQ